MYVPPEQTGSRNSRPERISFESLGLTFSVTYHETDSLRVRISDRGSELRLSGCVGDAGKRNAALRRWLKRKGHQLLLPMLKAESEQMGLHYRQAAIRLQKRCWGSCSRKRNISLNARLLFLPRPLMRYVMIHELAHLDEMNHSRAFWAVVERCDRNYPEHRRQLKLASHRIPAWVER